ncbi:alpha/beta hydrolase [Marinococcus luteus]|uniref:alpha/beta hydrolase n=1 Tax=Marinococcus luteus TaxID=1122204 RepID=UPI002ACC6833|nr:alpha/beta hydrolase [Marinococcus luteus]MDZ5784193.1 alpha/beta hydrolase [Marinococcus luteus]
MPVWRTYLLTSLLRAFQIRLRRYSPTHITPPTADAVRTDSYMVETAAGTTPVHIYYPEAAEGKALPVFVNLHGGGFFMGSYADDEGWGRYVAELTPCVVVNIDYHLAPRSRFPFSLFEIRDVIAWLHTHEDWLGLNMERFALGGHSAGGNIAASTLLLLRDTGAPMPAVQILDSPILDLATDPREKASFPGAIPIFVADLFTASYLETGQSAAHPYISPLRAESLKGLPPTLVFTPEYDSLAREAFRYAERLKQEGVPVEYQMFPKTIHAFTHVGRKSTAKKAWRLVVSTLQARLL